MSMLSCMLPHQRALAQGLAPKHATSPKDLGTYSPREVLMRRPISAHEFYYHVCCFGLASLTYTGNKSPSKLVKPRSDLKRKARHQGNQHPPRGQALAKLSPVLTPQEYSPLLHEYTSSLERVFLSLTFHGLLGRQRGALEHRDLRALTSLSLKHPPALLSHCSGIP